MKSNKPSPASSLPKPSSSSQPPLRAATPTRPATQTPPPASLPPAGTSSLSSQPVEPPLRATAPTPTNEAIAERARQIWEKEGRPSGRDLEIWLEAERQLQSPAGKDRIVDEIEPRMDEIEPDDALTGSIEKELDEEVPSLGGRRSATSLNPRA